MSLMGSISNPGRWDSELDYTTGDRYNNVELTIFMRVHLQQANPAGGAPVGTAREWGTDVAGVSGTGRGTARRIIRWNGGAWNRWCRRYRREVQSFWHGKFWLIAQHDFSELDYDDRGTTYRPNVWCRFRLEITPSAAGAHSTVSVVRLHRSERFFRSDSRHYDQRDLQLGRSRHSGRAYRQRTHVHEVGHLLGLGHAAETSAACVAGGNVGAEPCYCATEADCGNIMGAGSRVRRSNAAPWQRAMEEHGGGARANWRVRLRRHYPRTLDQVREGARILTRPTRG